MGLWLGKPHVSLATKAQLLTVLRGSGVGLGCPGWSHWEEVRKWKGGACKVSRSLRNALKGVQGLGHSPFSLLPAGHAMSSLFLDRRPHCDTQHFTGH